MALNPGIRVGPYEVTAEIGEGGYKTHGHANSRRFPWVVESQSVSAGWHCCV